MQAPEYLPHIDLLLQALRVNRDRLNSKSKVAIDAKLLRGLVQAMVARAPFSDEFYLQTYPDIAQAHAAGTIPDLHRHFIESGFFEGRFGVPPTVDEAFYTSYYKDVGQALRVPLIWNSQRKQKKNPARGLGFIKRIAAGGLAFKYCPSLIPVAMLAKVRFAPY